MVASNLLDTHLEALEASGKGLKTMTRVCVIGKLSAGASGSGFSSWCQKSLAPSGDSVTGLLLLLPDGFVHTLEGPQADIPPFLQSLHLCDQLAECRIISSQEDVRSAYFPHWTSAEANVQRSNYAEIDEDGVPGLLADTAIGMMKIGKKFTADRSSPQAAASLVAHWDQHFAEFMPSNERLGQLFELEGLPTLGDFLDIYETPVDVAMEGDQIWPPEHPQVY